MTEPRAAEVLAYIGIGSNLNDPEQQVSQAFAELARVGASRLQACSGLYRTAPVGPQDQPDYVNAAVCLQTRLGPAALLSVLQEVERKHGRVRDGTRWGPRTLDLDILLYGNRRIELPGLHVPHPELARRAFVLVPLADVAPLDLPIPGQGRLAELLERCPRQEIARLREAPACDLAGELAEFVRT